MYYISTSKKVKMNFREKHPIINCSQEIWLYVKGEVVQDWREIVTYFSYPVAARDYSWWPDTPSEWRAAMEAYSELMMMESITFSEMYKMKMSNDIELAHLKSLSNRNKDTGKPKFVETCKDLEEMLAWSYTFLIRLCITITSALVVYIVITRVQEPLHTKSITNYVANP